MEGRNGLIILDLGTGEAWRHLDLTPQVHADPDFMLSIWGQTIYFNSGPQSMIPITRFEVGSDGIAISADGETLYWSPVASRYLYSIPTARLRDRSQFSELLAQAAISNLGQKGVSDGLESDSNGIVYAGSFEQNAIVTYTPDNGTVQTYVRDPRIDWTDTMSVQGTYLYFTENQLFRAPAMQGGVDRRQKPYVVFRVPLAGNGTKIGT